MKNTSWYNPSDTEFTLRTPAQLAGLAELVNNGTDNFSGKTILLAADLDLGDREWKPIGDDENYFSGIFNGCGHTIANMKVESTYMGWMGFFSHLPEAGELKNLNLTHARVIGHCGFDDQPYAVKDKDSVRMDANGNAIVTVHLFELTDADGDGFAGSLVGENLGLVEKCSVDGSVAGASITGGLVGENIGLIRDCSMRGNVLGMMCVGGIAGENLGTVERCFMRGKVEGHEYVGGIVGDKVYGVVSDCRAEGGVTGYSHVHGLIGNGDSYALNCIAEVNVTDNTSPLENRTWGW
jgi:hypothetical protein